MELLHFGGKELLFLQVMVVIGLPLILWQSGLGRIMPLAIVQILAGIALGPSIFGLLMPDAFTFLFRKEVLEGIRTLGNIAVVMFVFLAGCHADRNVISNSAGFVLKAGLSGIGFPWVLGGLVAWAIVHFASPDLHGRLIGRLDNEIMYAVSFGLAMSVTALPVLIILLRELNFHTRPIGSIALAIGGLDDAVLWLSIALILPFAAGSDSWAAALGIAIGGGLVTWLLLTRVVSPFLQTLIDNEAPERFLMSATILVVFLAAFITQITGLHAAVGAFMAGLLLPDKLRHMAESKFDVPVALLLLPFFFLSTGLSTDFNVADPTIWALVAIAMVVCVGGKFLGITLPAIAMGQPFAFASTLGVLMQCKGLMEIVVVTVLYERGIFGPLTFAALVVTALISTAITAPLARLMVRLYGFERATQTAEAPAAIEVEAKPVVPAAPGVPSVEAPSLVPLPNASLVFEGEIGTIPVPKTEVVIGRHSSDDIRVKDLRVSRGHARLKALDDGRWELHNLTADRSEPNPVLVNGVDREHAIIKDGDLVSLGGIVFTFRTGEMRARPRTSA